MIRERLIRKADKSLCTYKIAAIAFSSKGNVLGMSFNEFRFSRFAGGLHAEIKLIRKFGKRIAWIEICRTNGNGKTLPIDPCENCKKVAEKLGIKIKQIGD